MKSIETIRSEIARSVRAVRAVCFGRDCLRECVRRMITAAPLRRVRRGGAAVVAAFALAWVMSANGAATCTWQDGGGYVCSGSGDTVIVDGGGIIGGDTVITNIIGVCTNCVNMSPDFIRMFKLTMHAEFMEPISFYDNMLTQLQNCKFIIDGLLKDYPIEHSPYHGTQAPISASNFLVSAGWPSGPYINKAAEIAFQEPNMPDFNKGNTLGRTTSVRYLVYSYDSAVSMYNYCCSQFDDDFRHELDQTISGIPAMKQQLQRLDSRIDELSSEECQPEWGGDDSSSGDDSGGGSVSVTNGNWCTYEQGEAIKHLLDDIGKWQRQTVLYASNLVLRARSIEDTVKNALFTSYNHIPTESQLGASWQDLYLSGFNDNFPGYQPTNILARIELLVAGMSGVLTNSTEYTGAEDTVDDAEQLSDDLTDSLNSLAGDFSNVVSEKEESSRNIGNALIRLYQTFRQWTGAPFSTEAVINSYSVEFEQGKALDIPAFAVASDSVGWANTIRSICRNCMTVVWILGTTWIFIGFQISFWRWCGKYIKWLIELAQGLFA